MSKQPTRRKHDRYEEINKTIYVYPDYPKDQPAILTHGGRFHCDDSLSTALLLSLPQYKNHNVVRINHHEMKKEILEKFDVVYDIGGVHDPKKFLFDHHQSGFEETFPGQKTKLSGAGLVYKHFGKTIIKNAAKEVNVELNRNEVKSLYKKMYLEFVEHVDGDDNGIKCREGDLNYRITTALPNRVGRLMPVHWNEPDLSVEEQFLKAVNLCGREFFLSLNYYLIHWIGAKSIVRECLKDSIMDGRVMILKSYIAWKSHLSDLEEELKCKGKLLFTIWKEETSKHWRILTVPKVPGTFENRMSLPKEWRGLRDEKLSEVAGIEGCTFVHSSGFTGGNKTKDGILKMIEKTFELNKNE